MHQQKNKFNAQLLMAKWNASPFSQILFALQITTQVFHHALEFQKVLPDGHVMQPLLGVNVTKQDLSSALVIQPMESDVT
ncbi:MAG: hypothetical protein ACKO96_31610 [Flammeovirgaceae bacterium]